MADDRSACGNLRRLPCVWMRCGTSKAAVFYARDLPAAPTELDANEPFKQQLAVIRLALGPSIGQGGVSNKVVPKMTLLSLPLAGGAIHTGTFISRKCHDAIGVLGAAAEVTACAEAGPLCDGRVQLAERSEISVEHPGAEFTIRLRPGRKGIPAALLRTARPLFRDEVLIP